MTPNDFGPTPATPQPAPNDRDPKTGARPYANVYAEQRDAWAKEVAEAIANSGVDQSAASQFFANGMHGNVESPGPA